MANASRRLILVAGATGYIGGRLASRLLEKGHRVRCLARRPEHLKQAPWVTPDVEVVLGDALDKNSLLGVMKGVDTAYYLIHSMSAGEGGFEERDRLAARNFAEAAREAGVGRIVYLGGLGRETEASLSHHLRSRQEVGDILRSTGVPVTEFRAAIIVGSGSVSFEMIRYLTERLPIMICPRWIHSLCQPIAIRDVLHYLLHTLEIAESSGKILEIGGADVLTYGDMMQRYAKIRGLKRFFIDVPVLTPRLSSYWVDLVTPIPASLARPLIQGLKNDAVCLSNEAAVLFGISPMGYEDAVKLALDRIQRDQIETIWYDAESSRNADLKNSKSLSTVLETREGFLIERRSIAIAVETERVFSVIREIGGDRGWYYADAVWDLRGLLDRIFGGVGMRRGRRHPTELHVGDALDFWRVEELDPGRVLRLRAEMKMPGRAWLQFEVAPEDRGSRLTLTAFFEPRGLWGLIYWYGLYPAHRLLFPGLIRRIKVRCERGL